MNNTMQKLFLAGLFCLWTLVAAYADVPPSQQAEVEHLIAYLENSDCSMLRNGREYSGEEGARHVRRKYGHFRDKIDSTEEFIELSASKSTISGKPYEVHCPGQPAKESATWLLEELAVYRRT